MPAPSSVRLYEEYLVLAVKTGDRGAGERLAARWRPRLLRTARRLLRDADAAEDAAQESWAGIERGLPRLSDPTKFPAFAYGVLRRRCADRVRRDRRMRGREGNVDEAARVAAPQNDPDRALDVAAAMARLSPERRAAAALYYGEGLSLAELALALGVPEGTAKSRLFLARRDLKRLLKEDEEGDRP